MTTYTEGPWHIRNDGSIGSVCRGGMIIARPVVEPKNEGDQEANAHLIAAAPTMYEYLTSLADDGDNKAHAIIKKITGS